MDDAATCYHEAGHAVIAYFMGGIVESLGLGGEADDVLPERFGECRIRWERPSFPTRQSSNRPQTPNRPQAPNHSQGSHQAMRIAMAEDSLRQIMTLLGGPLAEKMYEGMDYSLENLASASDDFQRIEQLFEEAGLSPEAFLPRLVQRVNAWLDCEIVWAAVAALADELDTHEWLEADAIDTVLQFWLPKSKLVILSSL